MSRFSGRPTVPALGLLLVLVAGCNQIDGRERNRRGNRLYRETMFPEAAAEYTKALGEVDSPLIHYNLGLSYYRITRPGDHTVMLDEAEAFACKTLPNTEPAATLMIKAAGNNAEAFVAAIKDMGKSESEAQDIIKTAPRPINIIYTRAQAEKVVAQLKTAGADVELQAPSICVKEGEKHWPFEECDPTLDDKIAAETKAMGKDLVGNELTKALGDALSRGDTEAAHHERDLITDKLDAATVEMPIECNEYKSVAEKVATCDKVPEATREELKTAFETASKAWATLPSDDVAMKALAKGCKAGSDAIKAAAKDCPLQAKAAQRCQGDDAPVVEPPPPPPERAKPDPKYAALTTEQRSGLRKTIDRISRQMDRHACQRAGFQCRKVEMCTANTLKLADSSATEFQAWMKGQPSDADLNAAIDKIEPVLEKLRKDRDEIQAIIDAKRHEAEELKSKIIEKHTFPKCDLQGAKSDEAKVKEVERDAAQQDGRLAPVVAQIKQLEFERDDLQLKFKTRTQMSAMWLDTAQFDKALGYWKDLLKLPASDRPSDAKIYNNLGGITLRGGDWRKAIEWYHKAVEVSDQPNKVAALQGIGNLAWDKLNKRILSPAENIELADLGIEALQEAARLDPKSVKLRSLTSSMYNFRALAHGASWAAALDRTSQEDLKAITSVLIKQANPSQGTPTPAPPSPTPTTPGPAPTPGKGSGSAASGTGSGSATTPATPTKTPAKAGGG